MSAAPMKQSDLLAQALLREFMHRRGFLSTLKTFDEESPRDEQTIASRNIMAQMLCWSDVAPRLNAEQKPPLPFMVQLCLYRLRKRGLRTAGREGAGTPNANDSSDDESSLLRQLDDRRRTHAVLKDKSKSVMAEVQELKAKEDSLDAQLVDVDNQLQQLRLQQQQQKKGEPEGKKAKKSKEEKSSNKSKSKDATAITAPVNVPSLGMTIVPTGSAAVGGASRGGVFDPLRMNNNAPGGGGSSGFNDSSSSLLGLGRSGGASAAAAGASGWKPGSAASSLPDGGDQRNYDPLLSFVPSARSLALATHVDQFAAQKRHKQEMLEAGLSASPGHLGNRKVLSDFELKEAAGDVAPLSAPQAGLASKRNRKEARAVAILTAGVSTTEEILHSRQQNLPRQQLSASSTGGGGGGGSAGGRNDGSADFDAASISPDSSAARRRLVSFE